MAAGEACTVVLRGATGQMIEEADRSLHDALSVLSQTVKETRVVLGGGCAEMAMAVAVDEEAKRTEGKKALAVEAFAKALRQVSTLSHFHFEEICENLTWFEGCVRRFLRFLPITQDTILLTWSRSFERLTMKVEKILD